MCAVIQLTLDDFGNIVEEQIVDSGSVYVAVDIWGSKEPDMYTDYVIDVV